MLHAPCDILSLDLQDIMGTHILNQGGRLLKSRLNPNGHIIDTIVYEQGHDAHPKRNITLLREAALTALTNKEGCRLHG